jgi:hypothetical protein
MRRGLALKESARVAFPILFFVVIGMTVGYSLLTPMSLAHRTLISSLLLQLLSRPAQGR